MADNEPLSVEVALNRFSRFYAEVVNLAAFDQLMMTVGEAEANLAYSGGEMPHRDSKKILENIFSSVKQTKRLMASDLSSLHHHLTTVMVSLDSSEDDGRSLNNKVKLVNKWLVELQVTMDEKKKLGNLLDYFKELEEIREELVGLSTASEDIKDTFLSLLESNKRMKKELEAEKRKSEKLEDKVGKVKDAFEDLKAKYTELFRKYELLVERTNQAKEAEKEKEKEQNDPAAGKDRNDKLWFDIEKSQKRYEDLLDKHKQIIREKDDLLKENEARFAADRKRLLDMIENLQRSATLGDKDLTKKDIQLKDTENDLRRLKQELEDERAVKKQAATFTDKELKEKKAEVAELRADLKEAQEKLEGFEASEALKLKKLEDRIRDQESQLLDMAEQKLGGDGSKAALKTLNDLKSFNKEGVEKFKELQNQNLELINQNRQLQKQVLDAQQEISDLLDRIKALEGTIREKEQAAQNVQKQLDLRIKADQAAYTHLVGIRKENQMLKDRLGSNEGAIRVLQKSNEKMQTKALDSSRLVDRLKFENDKFRTNYKITNAYSPRKFNDLPATMSSVPEYESAQQRHAHFSPYKSPGSQEPALNPNEVSFQNEAEPVSHFGSPANFAKSARERQTSPATAPQSLREAQFVRPKIKLFAFFKATSESQVSRSIVLNKPENRFTFKNLVSPDSGKRDTAHSADALFTQFELKSLNDQLYSAFQSEESILYLLFGQPINIKLFLVNKIVHTCVNRYISLVTGGLKDLALVVTSHRDFSGVLASSFREEKLESASARSSTVFVRLGQEDDEVQSLLLRSQSLDTLEKLKKVFFGLLSQQHAAKLDFLKLAIQDADGSSLQEVLAINSEIRKMPESVYTHLKDFLDAAAVNERTKPGQALALAELKVSGLCAHFFLVYQPAEEDPDLENKALLELSELHKTAALVKLNESLYV